MRTVTSLNTGLGDDEVWVDLQAGQRRLLRARHAGRVRARVRSRRRPARGRHQIPADSVRAWIDGAPVAVAYQPDGLVRLLGSGRPDAPVAIEVTRTYKQAFVLGAGAA